LKLTTFITAGSTYPESVSALRKYSGDRQAFKIVPIMIQHNKDAILQVAITLAA
jgi:hypothetical protein